MGRLISVGYKGYYGTVRLNSVEASSVSGRWSLYLGDGDKLAENWIFIDLLYWLMQQGDDVLTRMAGIAGTEYSPPV